MTTCDASLRLELGPRRVGPLGQSNVLGSVVGQADDPAVVLAGAVGVAELELLEPEDAVAEPPAQPVGGPAADPAQPDHDGVPVAAVRHGRVVRASVIVGSRLRSVGSIDSGRERSVAEARGVGRRGSTDRRRSARGPGDRRLPGRVRLALRPDHPGPGRLALVPLAGHTGGLRGGRGRHRSVRDAGASKRSDSPTGPARCRSPVGGSRSRETRTRPRSSSSTATPRVDATVGSCSRRGCSTAMVSRSLRIDLRNHGDSGTTGGRHTGGIRESADVLGAWDWLVAERDLTPERIGLFGISLGAASVVIAAGDEPGSLRSGRTAATATSTTPLGPRCAGTTCRRSCCRAACSSAGCSMVPGSERRARSPRWLDWPVGRSS